MASDLVGGAPGQLTELETLRRRLDPEHPDPDRLHRRVQAARRPPATASPAPARQPRLPSVAAASPVPLAQPPRRRLGGTPLLVAVNLVLVGLLVFAVLFIRGPLGDHWLGPAGTSAPRVSTVPPVTSPSPTGPPSPAPVGFRDCSQSLGEGGLCVARAECWAGVISPFDVPFIGTPVRCTKEHVYQTFAAGLLQKAYRRQSQYDKLPIVQRLCSAETLGTVLGDPTSAKRFQIIALPPQDDVVPVVRCIAGRGDRGKPLTFQPLR